MGNKKATAVQKPTKNKTTNNAAVYQVMAALVLLCGGLTVLRKLRASFSTVGGMETLDRLVPWMIIVGFVGCVAVAVVWAVWKNKTGRVFLPWCVVILGMTGVTGLSMKLFWTQGFSALYFLWVAVMVQIIIFMLYGWEFFLFSLPTAAAGFLFLNFSTGFTMSLWNVGVLLLAAVCMLVTVFCSRNASRHNGILTVGKLRIPMFSGKYTPTLHYLVCGLWLVCIAAALLLGSLFSYYCMFAAVAAEFIAAVYYTFQLN